MYKKQFYEHYAMLSLARCYSNDLQPMFDDHIEYENPDFQSKALDIGIEVVEAITTKQGTERSIVNRYFGKGFDGDALKVEAEGRFKKIKGKIEVVNGVAVYSHNKSGYKMSSRLNLISSKVDEKTQKLNGHYKQFKDNWLYVFAHTSLPRLDEIQSLSKTLFTEDVLQFNKVFINCIDKIYVLSKNEVTCIEVSENELKTLKSEAMKKTI